MEFPKEYYSRLWVCSNFTRHLADPAESNALLPRWKVENRRTIRTRRGGEAVVLWKENTGLSNHTFHTAFWSLVQRRSTWKSHWKDNAALAGVKSSAKEEKSRTRARARRVKYKTQEQKRTNTHAENRRMFLDNRARRWCSGSRIRSRSLRVLGKCIARTSKTVKNTVV